MDTYDTICLSGGGIKGFALVGCLEYLQNNLIIDTNKINNWVGTSAGSIIGFLHSIGYTTQEIIDFIIDFNFKSLDSGANIDSLLMSFGINNGIKIIILLSRLLKEKLDYEDINFLKHYELTKKKLTIIGTNYSKGLEVAFNYETYPLMSILTAIRISISVPVIFEPVLFNDDYYVDGCLTNNFPLNYCDPKTTLGIYIKYSCLNKLNNILELLVGCMNIIADSISLKDNFDNKYKIIEIINNSEDFINFELTREKKLDIINIGYIYAEQFINNLDKITEPKVDKITEPKVDKITEPKVDKITEPKVDKITEPKVDKITEQLDNNI
jgi:predicted patatin/cPLA2 family phospholipase